MKSILLGLIAVCLASISQAESVRDQFNQQPNHDERRAQVESIAKEQGIDMSTHEGRKMMAQYLQQSGQSNLLPPRQGGQMQGQQGGQGNPQGGFQGGNQGQNQGNCNQGGGQRPPRPMGQRPTES